MVSGDPHPPPPPSPPGLPLLEGCKWPRGLAAGGGGSTSPLIIDGNQELLLQLLKAVV